MSTKQYLQSPEDVAAMDATELELCFDLGEDDVVYGFSPESLRAACNASRANCILLGEKLGARVARAADDNTVKLDRPGYIVPLTDLEFLRKLSKLAKECFAGADWPDDADEAGYAAYVAERERRLALRRKPVEKVDAEPVEGVAMPAKAAEPDAPADEALAECDPIFLEAKIFDGQLNISQLFCGSMVLSAGNHTRKHYTAKKPLIVDRISGIRFGTTTVSYIGEELRGPDVETWVNAIRFGASLPLGQPVHLKESKMLKALRRRDGGNDYKLLREQLTRLQNAKLVIETDLPGLIGSIADALPEDTEVQAARKSGKLKITVSLLGDSSTSTPSKRGSHSVHIPPNVRALFGKGLSTWFREDAYYGLTNPTARRLYLLFGRHVSPRPFTLPELRSFLGLNFDRESDLLESIEAALTEMFERGYLVGDAVPEYSTNYPGANGGLKRSSGEKAFAVQLKKDVAPSAVVAVA